MSDDDFDPDDIETYADDADDEFVRLRKTDLSKVRKAARKTSGLSKAEREELDALRTEKVVREADLGALTPRQIAVVAREAGNDKTPAALRQVAEDLGFIAPPQPSEEEQQIETEISQQQQAVAATNGAPPANSQTTVTAEEVASWPVEKLMRLDRAHPDTYELAMRGEAITLPPGFN